MSDELYRTIKIQRGSKVGTDSKGRTVWTKPIEPVELELVSTTMLEQILESDDAEQRARLRAMADARDGVLARDTSNNEFAVVSDDELEAALAAANAGDAGKPPADCRLETISEAPADEELSLVSTQALRKILSADDEVNEPDSGAAVDEGGYNPYDSS